VPSTGGFHRLLPVLGAVRCCSSRSTARSWPRNHAHLANVGYILFCAIVTIVATALMPDYTNRDISEELV
jgi:hypothetical protein